MTVFNNYSLRNLPSVNFGRQNVWNRHFAHANAARENFFNTVPPYNSSLFIGFPGCGFPPIPMLPPRPSFCCYPAVTPFNGFMVANFIGQTVGNVVGVFRSLFTKK